MKPCLIIPIYNHGAQFQHYLPQLLPYELPIIIVDDGSDASTKATLDTLPTSITRITHTINQGKGGAVISGLLAAHRLGYTHALQIDADGQHQHTDIPRFIKTATDHPTALINGAPIYDESAPAARKFGHKFTNFWVALETWSTDIHDSLCGFRVYPLAKTANVVTSTRLSQRMGFDLEIVIRLYWAGVPVVNLATDVIYPEDGQSHFRGFQDNVEISWVHTKLIFGMLWRWPLLLARKWRRA